MIRNTIHDHCFFTHLIRRDIDSNDILFGSGSCVTHLSSDLIDTPGNIHVPLGPICDCPLIAINLLWLCLVISFHGVVTVCKSLICCLPPLFIRLGKGRIASLNFVVIVVVDDNDFAHYLFDLIIGFVFSSPF
jgi:hypothetical protein